MRVPYTEMGNTGAGRLGRSQGNEETGLDMCILTCRLDTEVDICRQLVLETGVLGVAPAWRSKCRGHQGVSVA